MSPKAAATEFAAAAVFYQLIITLPLQRLPRRCKKSLLLPAPTCEIPIFHSISKSDARSADA